MAATETAFGNASREGASIMIGEADFEKVEGDSIDYAIMEKTDRAAVVSPVTIGWDDIGSWAAVKAFSKPGTDTDAGILIECPDTVLKAEEGAPLVAAVGLEGFVIVSTKKAVLIVPEDRAQDVKTIVQMLKDQGREDLL
jgi:mannose-1-phosphate guanylyltransferase